MLEKIKSWFLAHFLKRYNENTIRPRRYIETHDLHDEVTFRDHYADRYDDDEYRKVDLKVQQALEDLKAKGLL